MAVTSQVSENAFAPYRGTEAQCQAYPSSPGAVFFAYDTNKIFFDDAEGNRHVMSGSGIKFVYGDCADTLVATDDSDGLLPFPREAITSAYLLIDKPVETYQREDIIINYDGTLYRIKKIDDEFCWVEKILVSGTGGGGGGDSTTISVIYTVPFPSMIAKGQNATATIKIVDTKRGSRADLEFDFYESRNAVNPYRETYAPPHVNLTNGVGTANISIPASYLRTGLTVLKLKVYVNDRESDTDVTSFTVVDIKYEPTNQWNASVAKRYADGASGITFPWQLTLGSGVTAEDLFQQGTIKVTATIDASNGGPHIDEDIVETTGVLELWPLFEDASHGAHTLDIVAKMTIGTTTVEISHDLHYEIGWVKNNEGIIIWSPFRRTGQEFVNYTLITIPFIVYDPANLVGVTTTTYYINDEEISSEDLGYNGSYNYWEIIKYNLGSNTFTISAGDTTWTAIVNIKPETQYSLEPTPGTILYLSAAGRTNNERASKRAQWPNEVTTSNNKVLKEPSQNGFVDSPVVLSGFNWYNNGWIKDSEGNTALRVSNGASVFIPATLFASGGGTSPGQTYEFDFAVHNAVDYSRLINTQTKYLTYNELVTKKWFDSDTRTAIPYDLSLYEPSESGNNDSLARKIAQGDDTDTPVGSYVPEVNELTGSEMAIRVVSSNSDSAFLTYYASNRGIVLGTQEAFLSLSNSVLVSARYTDDVRVKVSFVVGPAVSTKPGETVIPMIYAYINGVLTSVLEYNAGAQFSQTFDGKAGITITSDCCDVDIYGIRIYEQPLMFADIGQNWTADAPTLPLKKERYLCGKKIVKSDGSNLDYLETKKSGLIPVMVISTVDLPTISKTQDRLPYFKGNKIGVNIRYYDPKNPKRCFHLSNSQINVQGTSSQAYPRRNFKFQVKEGSSDWSDPVKMGTIDLAVNEMRIEHWDGEEANKDIFTGDYGDYISYKRNKDNRSKNKGSIDIGVGLKATAFCLKADYMDSSSVHNTAGANYATALLNNNTSYDLRHPLQRILGTSATAAYRTTVWGFPILVFWENSTGNIEYIGRYNFNIDKASENVFGFVDDTEQPNVLGEGVSYVEEDDPDNEGETITVKYFKAPVFDKDADDYVMGDVPCTYTNVTQCWELTNNQAGYSKFNDGDDNWLDQGTTKSGDPYYLIQDHFEQRYPEMEDEEDTKEWRAKTVELGKLWDWIRRTDVTSYQYTDANRPKRTIEEPVYYKTISSEYESNITYYSVENNEYTPVDIHVEKTFTPTGLFLTKDITYDENNNPIGNAYSSDLLSVSDQTALLKFIRVANDGAQNENSDANDKQYIGEHDFIYENDAWNYGLTTINDLSEIGITLGNGNFKHFVLKFAINAVGFNVDLYEKFEYDTNRYRLCKFKTELPKHLNLNYCLFYFIYTEFFLLYDSRQKNMMISSWGPETPGGEYIWYPIFYDLDTQLGVNNSGQVYWDYDEDATPPLFLRPVTRTIAGQTIPDVEVDSETGNTDSIFSGNGSVLWNNMYLCFKSEIMKMYNALRKSDFNQEKVEYYFETNGSDKWSPVMKNYDAYYKYLAPATVGYTDQEGNNKKTSLYYYCLQGDRSLQRKTMIRNRFNYLDSAWAAGAYDPLSTKTQIKMRYNLNDVQRTSSSTYPSSASYIITPYLSQYVSVLYDETPSIVQKFKLGGGVRTVTVPPPTTIAKKAALGTALTQQLAYIRGPQYLSSIGDLSNKYLNELDITNAERLRELKVGDDQEGYRNIALTSVEVGAKGLLRLVDLSNLSEIDKDPKVSGCAKLEVLKLLGTKIGDVAMPQGSVLTTVYLPSTVTMISLQRPLKLDRLLTTKPTHVNSGADPIGLYIDNLTDKLPAFEATGTIPAEATSSIDLLQLDDTQLGYGSYRLLNYLFNIKREAQQAHLNNQTATTKELSISCANADWSSFVQVEPDASFDSSLASRYRKRDISYIEYSNYSYSDPGTWAKDVKNGLIYIEDSARGTSPIKDLSMFKFFADQLDNQLVTYANYFFRPVGNTQGAKVIPTISGRLHVANTEQTKINEAEVFAFYQKNGHYPKLDITADYVERAHRARFIEYLPDGTIKELGTQKWHQSVADLSPTVAYTFDAPTRLHYDFLGWSLANTSTFDWETRKSVNDDWMEYGAIGDRTQVIINEIGTAKTQKNLSTYSLEDNETLTFVAVYAIHGYLISYVMDDGTTPVYTYNSTTREYDIPLVSVAVAGRPVDFSDVIPWKDDGALGTFTTYRFKGWRISNDNNATLYNKGTNPVLTVDRNTTVFAAFDQESVYAHPLTENELEIRWAGESRTNVNVTIKLDKQLRGKICIPSQVTWTPPSENQAVTSNVVGLLATAIEGNDFVRTVDDPDYDGGNLSWQPALTHVFFSGCESNTAAPDHIINFHPYCFYGSGLTYIDIPASLQRIDTQAFQYVNFNPKIFNNMKNVANFNTTAFYGAWKDAYDLGQHELDLQLSANVYNGFNGQGGEIQAGGINSTAFNNTPIRKLFIGDNSNRVNVTSFYAIRDGAFSGATSIEEVTIYVSADIKNSTELRNALISNIKYALDESIREDVDIYIV